MKKGKIVMTITIGLMCFVLVYVMFLQFKVVEQTDLTEIETMQEQAKNASESAKKAASSVSGGASVSNFTPSSYTATAVGSDSTHAVSLFPWKASVHNHPKPSYTYYEG